MKDILRQKDSKTIALLILLCIAGFSIPFSSAFNSICIGVLFIYSFIWFKKESYQVLFKEKTSVIVLCFLFFIVQGVGIFYSESKDIAVNNLTKNIIFILIPVTFVNLSKKIDNHAVKSSVLGLIIGVFLILLSAHFRILTYVFSGKHEFISVFTYFVRVEFVQEAIVFIHPPYFGILVVFCITAIIQIDFLRDRKRNHILKFITIIYLIFSLYEISSFMSLILLILIFLFYIYRLLKKGKPIIPILIITISIGMIGFLSSVDYGDTMRDFKGGSIFKRIEWSFIKGKWDTSRPENWKSVILVSQNNLILGAGSDGGIEKLQCYRSKYSESFKDKHNAHNQYLEVLLRYGLIGLSIYLAMLFKFFKIAFTARDISFIWFLLIFTISCLTESYLQRQIGLTFFLFYAIMFSTLYNFGFLGRTKI